jgi:hypothetical protein
VRELSLGEPAHRALALIYGLSLANETLSIAGMARALGDWTEPLGQGELGTHELIRRTPTGVVLRRWAAMYLDGTRGLN